MERDADSLSGAGNPMTHFLARRIGQSLATLLFISMMIFGLARLTGDPTPLVMPAEATQQDKDFFRKQYGLDESLPVQYAIFLRNVVKGDFGTSFRYREPAAGHVLAALGPTLALAASAMVASTLVGVALGVVAALHRATLLDRAIDLYAGLGQAMPTFWVGLLLVSVFTIQFGLLPSSGYGEPANFVLPVATLTFYASSSIVRLTRTNMIEALRSDFVRMHVVLGLPRWRILLVHALRNAALPIVTFLGLEFGLLLGGAVVTERVFAWPGIGQLIVEAILSRDYPIIQASVLMTAVLVMAVNLVVDALYALLDPRLRP